MGQLVSNPRPSRATLVQRTSKLARHCSKRARQEAHFGRPCLPMTNAGQDYSKLGQRGAGWPGGLCRRALGAIAEAKDRLKMRLWSLEFIQVLHFAGARSDLQRALDHRRQTDYALLPLGGVAIPIAVTLRKTRTEVGGTFWMGDPRMRLGVCSKHAPEVVEQEVAHGRPEVRNGGVRSFGRTWALGARSLTNIGAFPSTVRRGSFSCGSRADLAELGQIGGARPARDARSRFRLTHPCRKRGLSSHSEP